MAPDQTYDVVVLGSGIAGLSGALAARRSSSSKAAGCVCAEVDATLRDIYATPKAVVQRYEAIRNER